MAALALVSSAWGVKIPASNSKSVAYILSHSDVAPVSQSSCHGEQPTALALLVSLTKRFAFGALEDWYQ